MMIVCFANGGTLSGVLLLISIIITNPLILDKIPKLKWKATVPISIVLLFVSAGVSPDFSDDTINTNNPQIDETTTTTSITTTTATEISTEITTTTTTIETTVITEPSTTTTVITSIETTQEITTIQETELQEIEEPQQNDSQSITVYITPTGKKYHYSSNCGNGTYIPVSLDEAISKSYEPCKKCF